MNPPPMRSYPKSIYVGHREWRVVFKPNVGMTGKRHNWGLCNNEEKTIYIKTKLDGYNRFVTFVHEVIHAVEYEYGFDIPHKLVECMDVGIANLLLVNDGMMHGFMQGIRKPPGPKTGGHPRAPRGTGDAAAVLVGHLAVANALAHAENRVDADAIPGCKSLVG